MLEERKLNVAILGKSFISSTVADHINKAAKKVKIVALVTRNKDEASHKFAEENGIKEILTAEEVKDAPHIDLVYIASPNSEHTHLAQFFMKMGKHVIIEKPMAITEEEVQDILDVAAQQQKFCMEALMYLCHPATKHLLDLTTKYLGKIIKITARYGADIFMRENPVQGGAIRNLGCYPISLVRYIAKTEPTKLRHCSGTMDDTGQRDTSAKVTLEFENGLKAFVETSSLTKFFELRITDENERTLVAKTNPWLQDKLSKFELLDNHGIVIPIPESDAQYYEEQLLYAHEFDIAAEYIRTGKISPLEHGVTWVHSLGNAKILEQWVTQIKLTSISEAQVMA